MKNTHDRRIDILGRKNIHDRRKDIHDRRKDIWGR